jgi:hypothetical protein
MYVEAFAPLTRRRWPGMVLGALLWCAVAAWPAGAGAAAPERASIAGRALPPEASWHGRAVQSAHEHRTQLSKAASPPAGWSAGAVRRGSGRERPSQRVREIQRRLTRLGYEPGPVDGRFGPRTQAAVGWFQLKHGLPVTGVATVATARHVRDRSRSGPEETGTQTQDRNESSRSAAVPDAPGRDDTATPEAQTEPAAAGRDTSDDAQAWWLPLLVAVAASALTLLAVALWQRLRGRRGGDQPVYELWAEGRSPDPEVGGFKGVVKAVSVPEKPRPRGYVEESQYLVEDPTRNKAFWVPAAAVEQLGAARQEPDVPDADRRRALGYVNLPPNDPAARRDPSGGLTAETGDIDATCRERGWELLQIVRDSAPITGAHRERPGLSFALERLAAGEGSCLVVGRLGHLARSVSELGGLLDWFSEHDATLVVCDIELDTSTSTGRRTAQTLAAVSAWERTRTERRPAHRS